jgi:hypothetical protein
MWFISLENLIKNGLKYAVKNLRLFSVGYLQVKWRSFVFCKSEKKHKLESLILSKTTENSPNWGIKKMAERTRSTIFFHSS